MPPIDLHKPDPTPGLRAQVVIKPGPLADAILQLAESAQLDPAAVLRMLAAEALEARRLRKAG